MSQPSRPASEIRSAPQAGTPARAPIDFLLRGGHITLDALLKATGLADSGGRAKAMVAAGLVQVDGQLELRKTCKLRAGQVVALEGVSVRIHAAPPHAPAAGHGS
jgi:ribosome-associated protein